MLPSAFEYHRAETLDEALSIALHARRRGESARRRAEPDPDDEASLRRSPGHLVDINRDRRARRDRGGATASCTIGALVRHNSLAASDVDQAGTRRSRRPRRRSPTRSCATSARIGGSLSHADPAGDLGSTMLADGRERRAARAPAASGWCRSTSSWSTRSRRAPARRDADARSGCRRRRLAPAAPTSSSNARSATGRPSGSPSRSRCRTASIGRAGIGLTGVGLKNIEATDAEQALAGAEPTDEAFAEAGRMAAAARARSRDVRGPEEYKRHMIEVFVRRGLAQARDAAERGLRRGRASNADHGHGQRRRAHGRRRAARCSWCT